MVSLYEEILELWRVRLDRREQEEAISTNYLEELDLWRRLRDVVTVHRDA